MARTDFKLIREFDTVHELQDDSLASNNSFGILLRIKNIQRAWNHCRKISSLLRRQIRRGFLEIETRCRFGTVNAVAPFDHVQIYLEYAFFG